MFPGRCTDEKIKERYFYKSIETVNIGAFPLLPDSQHPDEEGKLLREHLTDVILGKTKYQQIEKSIPQKGLAYTEQGNGKGVALVMMEKYSTKIKSFSNGRIAVPIKLTENGMTLLENRDNISYVLFHTRNKDNNKHLFFNKSIVRILNKDDASTNGYYLVQSTAKRYLCLEVDMQKELDSTSINPSKEKVDYEDKERYDSQYVEINDIND